MISPFALPPHPLAQAAARAIINKVHAYMRAHANSELHRQGKMFGVLVVEGLPATSEPYLAAFSAKLDGSYYHEGFVPPVLEMTVPPVGTDKTESRRLQRLLFANYRLTNGKGETKNLLDIFAGEKPIVPADEWFDKSQNDHSLTRIPLPPSGAGECCAPKLLQYALSHGLKPVALAEFWVGASPHTEIRREGCFYPPCSGRCVPILRHMLQGIAVEPLPQVQQAAYLCSLIEIVYEDDYLMVVNKPAGLLSVPGKNEEPSLTQYLASQGCFSYLQPVHRLDQDTSGLLVLAKNQDIYKILQSYFQRRDILKRYETVVRPFDSLPSKVEDQPEGTITLPLLPNPYDRPRQMVDSMHGKPAVTRYVVREKRTDGSVLIDFFPLTGRTHQLRVHAAHTDGLNAPIVGDRLYNGHMTNSGRLMLHAAEISFVHPVTKEEMHFCIPSRF